MTTEPTEAEYCTTFNKNLRVTLWYHKRTVHQVSAGVKYPNQAEINIFRGADSFFHCKFCPYSSVDPSTLQVSLFLLLNDNCILTIALDPHVKTMWQGSKRSFHESY